MVLLERVGMLGRFGATLVFVRGTAFGRAFELGFAFMLGRPSIPALGRAFGVPLGRAWLLSPGRLPGAIPPGRLMSPALPTRGLVGCPPGRPS